MHAVDQTIGDHIAMESCVDMAANQAGRCGVVGGGRTDDQRWGTITKERKAGKEYPPPLRCLARTGNVPKSHVPRVMKRYWTEDGRLIIREESADSEFLQAHRSNGRLTIHLVHMSEEATTNNESCDEENINDEEEKEKEINAGAVTVADDNVKSAIGGQRIGGVGSAGSGAVKCYKYETARSSSCLNVILPVTAM